MLRFWTACLALILAPLAAADSKELKPKFGDIGGVFYTEVSEDREACRQAIGNKIALCRQNTSFVSNTLDRKYPGCLPIFRQQAEICAAHFRREAVNCEIQGSARIADFTGFSCEVTATVVEEGGEPERTPGIAPADRPMQARTRTNMRSGPGTDHAKVGLLEAGEEVRVTGEAGEWLRFEASGGSTAFVYGSLLVEPASKGSDPARQGSDAPSKVSDVASKGSDAAATLSPKCVKEGENAGCWVELADPLGCYFWFNYFTPTLSWSWSGACRDGVAEGRGTLAMTWSGGSTEFTGALDEGKLHGHWVIRYDTGKVDEGPYVNGRREGLWIRHHIGGDVSENMYEDDRRIDP